MSAYPAFDRRIHTAKRPSLFKLRPRGWRVLSPGAWRRAAVARKVMEFWIMRNGGVIAFAPTPNAARLKGSGMELLCTCPRSPIPYWDGDSRCAINLGCPTHGWLLETSADDQEG